MNDPAAPRFTMPIVRSRRAQLWRWVWGRSVHYYREDELGVGLECCPDDSCCTAPRWPLLERILYLVRGER